MKFKHVVKVGSTEESPKELRWEMKVVGSRAELWCNGQIILSVGANGTMESFSFNAKEIGLKKSTPFFVDLPVGSSE